MARLDGEAGADIAVIGDIVPLTQAELRWWREQDDREADALPLVGARTERFVSAGVTGVLGIASLSLNSLRDIECGWRIGFAVLMFLGLGFLFLSANCTLPAPKEDGNVDTDGACDKIQKMLREALECLKRSNLFLSADGTLPAPKEGGSVDSDEARDKIQKMLREELECLKRSNLFLSADCTPPVSKEGGSVDTDEARDKIKKMIREELECLKRFNLFLSADCTLPAPKEDGSVDNDEARDKIKKMLREELECLKRSKCWTLASFLLISTATAISWFAPQEFASRTTT